MDVHPVLHGKTEPLLPLLPLMRKAVIVGCIRPGCTYTASALSEGRAIRSLAAHIVKAHLTERTHARHN